MTAKIIQFPGTFIDRAFMARINKLCDEEMDLVYDFLIMARNKGIKVEYLTVTWDDIGLPTVEEYESRNRNLEKELK